MADITGKLIKASVGQLEVDIVKAAEHADELMQGSRWVAVVCHPHPLHGGSKDNKVVHTLCRAWRDIGVECVRFNFRGVGKSEGQFDHGEGELTDLKDVIAFVTHRYKGYDGLIVAGFSFGAYIAAKYATVPVNNAELPLKALLLVAPPVQYEDFSGAMGLYVPVQVIQGDQDEVVSFDHVQAWVKQSRLDGALIQLDVLKNAGHFFHGRLTELKQLTQQFSQTVFNQSQVS